MEGMDAIWSVRLSGDELSWIRKQGVEYLKEKLAEGKATMVHVGEISYTSLQRLKSLQQLEEANEEVEKANEEDEVLILLERVTGETGVRLWGSEGNRILTIGAFELKAKEAKRIRKMSLVWERPISSVLKAIILQPKGYTLYHGDLPIRNRQGIPIIRKSIKKYSIKKYREQNKCFPEFLYNAKISICLKLLGIPYD